MSGVKALALGSSSVGIIFGIIVVSIKSNIDNNNNIIITLVDGQVTSSQLQATESESDSDSTTRDSDYWVVCAFTSTLRSASPWAGGTGCVD